MLFIIETKENGTQFIETLGERVQILSEDNNNFAPVGEEHVGVLLWDDYDFSTKDNIEKSYHFCEGDTLTVIVNDDMQKTYQF